MEKQIQKNFNNSIILITIFYEFEMCISFPIYQNNFPIENFSSNNMVKDLFQYKALIV